MNSVNNTLYIPLYGKSYVSRRGLFLKDPKAEEIWAAEGFPLKGKSKSKWLAFYMGIRSAVFDDWTRQQMQAHPDAVVIHLGCGMDSRCLRVEHPGRLWYETIPTDPKISVSRIPKSVSRSRSGEPISSRTSSFIWRLSAFLFATNRTFRFILIANGISTS